MTIFSHTVCALASVADFHSGGPQLNRADTAWIIVVTALVLFMTLPGLALFNGGLVRARNVLSVDMQCYAIACLISVLWFVFESLHGEEISLRLLGTPLFWETQLIEQKT